jgi:hypothetical protein
VVDYELGQGVTDAHRSETNRPRLVIVVLGGRLPGGIGRGFDGQHGPATERASTEVRHAANTTWLARGYGNIFDNPAGPNYTSPAAYDQATSPGRILIFPGGSYPEAVNMTGTKSLTIQTLENAANPGF